ncbi:MAG TPA: hypothetical protein VKP10_14105 [Gemmatimonadales bacterium]|nr:hypothetical protein [Gemmatimonadales bacterium]
MRVLTRRLSLALLLSLLVSTAATAQVSRPTLGPQLGFATNDFDLFVGGQFSYQVAPRFDIYPSVIIYFPNGPLNAWGLNANVRYWPKLNMPNAGLYAGGGLGYTHFSAFGFGDSRVGLNLLGGWEFHTPSLSPFVELRAVLASDVDRLEFVGGLSFKLR